MFLIFHFSHHLEYQKYTEEQENSDGEKENTGGHVRVEEISVLLGRIDLGSMELVERRRFYFTLK